MLSGGAAVLQETMPQGDADGERMDSKDGVRAYLAKHGLGQVPPVAKLPLGAVCSLAPFLALAAGVAVPQASSLPLSPPFDLSCRRSLPFTPSLAAPRPCRRR